MFVDCFFVVAGFFGFFFFFFGGVKGEWNGGGQDLCSHSQIWSKFCVL